MGRGAKSANANSEGRPTVTGESRKVGDATSLQLEQRLAEALEQHAAISKILQVISASPSDVQPVLDTVAASAARLCGSSDAEIFRRDGDSLRLVAHHGLIPSGSVGMVTLPLVRESINGRATLAGQTVHVADLQAEANEFPFGSKVAHQQGWRTHLCVPMMRDGVAIGTISLRRAAVELFTERQIALLQTFADQAVIAIENVRLFNETKEALERQNATSEILSVISKSPTDVQPAFDTIAVAALKLCGASNVNVFTFDGELIHLAALVNLSPAGAEALRGLWPQKPSRGMAAARAILTGRMVEIPDVLEDPDFSARDAAIVGNFRSILAVPLMREGRPIGAIAVGRPEAGPFSGSQGALLETFADQAVIAIENVRLFTELDARNRDLTEVLERQTATSEILRVISRSPTDVQPVFDTIADAALNLCKAANAIVFTFDGELIHLAAIASNAPEGADAMRKVFPRPPSRETAAARAVLTRNLVVIPDVMEDPEFRIGFTAATTGFRSIVSIPLMREGNPIGVLGVGRSEPGPFPDKQIELLKTFADQAVIAIENVRLFNETKEALEQQQASGEVLSAISSSIADTAPVFDKILASCERLFAGTTIGITLVDNDGLIRLGVFHGTGREQMEKIYPAPVDGSSGSGLAILRRDIVHYPDVLNGDDVPDRVRVGCQATGVKSIIFAPMLWEGNGIGTIFVGRGYAGPFSEKEIALLKIFADQAVIAIQNARLFNETKEALEQQTATAEILKVISTSPTDVQPVFEAIAQRAAMLSEAKFSYVTTFDGEWIHLRATHGPGTEEHYAFYPIRPGSGAVSARVTRDRAPVQIPDVLADAAYAQKEAARTQGFRSAVGVPMLREGKVVGAIAVARPEPGFVPDQLVRLLQTFADQAVIAIENVRLFKELEARTTQLTRSVGELKALGEVGQAVSSTLDLETVLSTIVSRATGLAGMDAGAIYEYDEARGEFYLHTADRLQDEVVTALRGGPIRKGEGALGRMAMTGEPAQIRDIMTDASYQSRLREIILRLGYRSLMAVPLMRDDHLLGGLVVYRKAPGEFDASVIDLLRTFATQSALAIQNARLFREIEETSRELATASRHKSEFLANMSHELRTPLNAIIGFSEVLAERMFGEINDKQAEYLADILESGRHLLSLINDILDLSKIEAGRMELEPTEFNLADAIENTLTLVRERAHRHGIALGRMVDERLGTICADERKVKQVLLNLLSNSLKFTPEGGRIDVAATVTDNAIEISVSDTGVGIAAEDQAAVFEEFRQVGAASKKIEGTGLGLAISRKFIELHGGKIWVKSQVGVGSTFAFTLPLQ